MFFSFLNRFTSKKSPPPHIKTDSKNLFHDAAYEMGGQFFKDFKLFHHDAVTMIDLLMFVPEWGLYLGEINSWRFEDLKDASVERSSRMSKKPSTTRFESTQSKIQQKLQDVLSFDSTSCERFMWMQYLSEEEFDALDSSFHELLPKSRLIFQDDSLDTIIQKFQNLAQMQDEPYSPVKVIGALNAHLLLLPTPEAPFGSFLSDEQHRFLSKEFEDCVTTLCGEYKSGKSTVLIRKALTTLLNHSDATVLIITPTLLSGELLRNEFVSLMEYAALDINLSRIAFLTPKDFETMYESKLFQDATAIFCDDSHLMADDFIDSLKRQRDNRWLMLTMLAPLPGSSGIEVLFHNFRNNVTVESLVCSPEDLMIMTLLEMRKRIPESSVNDLMAIFPDMDTLIHFKPAIDEYLGINSRILTPEFSLQYENLDDMILTTSQMISGISARHLFLVTPEPSEDYTFMLSRASETATIISYSNPDGETDEEDYQE